ncbi:hypothetical protein QR680_018392 [Steinernema hermaphroditum]|uniref:Uncharacterized protein n=1 Tax=Steinernema hermaphroditum TaxID=289476 RepID=A0AA39LQ96_9BILA|nr:hypothetical protein QR680_018392 [Steinernema hermaphroditum]
MVFGTVIIRNQSAVHRVPVGYFEQSANITTLPLKPLRSIGHSTARLFSTSDMRAVLLLATYMVAFACVASAADTTTNSSATTTFSANTTASNTTKGSAPVSMLAATAFASILAYFIH